MTNAPDVDAGLQAERTAMSWRRTALSSFVVAALMLRQAADIGTESAAFAPLVGVGVLLVLALASYRRGHSLSQERFGPSSILARRRVMAATSIAVAISGLSAALIVFAPR